MKIPSIKFATLNLSIERTLQTLGLMLILMIQVVGFFIVPIASYYILVFTKLRWICLLYFAWYLTIDKGTPERGGRRSEWFRSLICWYYAKNYFPIKMIKLSSCYLDAKRNYIFSYFPHGLLATGSFITLATDATDFNKLFPHHTPYAHTISLFFKMPFLREVVLWLGGVPVTEKSISYIQSRPEGGNVSGITVGGAVEAYFCKPGLNKLVLRKRKGFVRIALKTGSPLVPVYCFGETDLYSQWEIEENSLLDRFRNGVKKVTGFTIVLVRGRGLFQCSFGILPQRKPVTVVDENLQH
ncbi:2-acylglycerol O-acyltransferase 2-like isoform X4 [Coccinella septempunctata]|uniref:2-acylglycerol O-acyltransferase 2-like isoform X4 n=1 Tax=Coccinella septempunctata TaxID=41139 RepID=UPI001D06803A|nr:2-acylglycerol O-acyltransferase 2-like isoform X4 [Coccinella septempunctata]